VSNGWGMVTGDVFAAAARVSLDLESVAVPVPFAAVVVVVMVKVLAPVVVVVVKVPAVLIVCVIVVVANTVVAPVCVELVSSSHWTMGDKTRRRANRRNNIRGRWKKCVPRPRPCLWMVDLRSPLNRSSIVMTPALHTSPVCNDPLICS